MATKKHTKKLKELKKAIKGVMPIATSAQKRTGNKSGDYVGNPVRWNNVDQRLKDAISREEYMVGFAFRMIGNNGHNGSIVKNASDLDK